jgi:hypothetical protein
MAKPENTPGIEQLVDASGAAPAAPEVTTDAPATVLKALSRWDPEVLASPRIMRRLADVGPTGKAFKCLVCGKLLVAEESQELGAGHRCDAMVQLMTPAQWAEHYASMTSVKVPEGMVSLNAVYDSARWYGRSAKSFLDRCGGDRSVDAEADILVTYAKGRRWVAASYLTAEFIKSLPVSTKPMDRATGKRPKYAEEVQGM